MLKLSDWHQRKIHTKHKPLFVEKTMVGAMTYLFITEEDKLSQTNQTHYYMKIKINN